MAHRNFGNDEYQLSPLEPGPVSARHLKRELAWMDRLFEEWFNTLDELRVACDGAEVRRIRTLSDRSDHLVNAIGELRPPRRPAMWAVRSSESSNNT